MCYSMCRLKGYAAIKALMSGSVGHVVRYRCRSPSCRWYAAGLIFKRGMLKRGFQVGL